MTEATSWKPFVKGQLVAHFEAHGYPASKTIRQIDELMPQLSEADVDELIIVVRF
jgi:hypothetical protein